MCHNAHGEQKYKWIWTEWQQAALRFNLLLNSTSMQFSCVSVSPNVWILTLSDNLLAIFMLWFCLRHTNMHSVCAAFCSVNKHSVFSAGTSTPSRSTMPLATKHHVPHTQIKAKHCNVYTWHFIHSSSSEWLLTQSINNISIFFTYSWNK